MSLQTNLENNYNPHRIFKLVRDYLDSTIPIKDLTKPQITALIHLSIRIQMALPELIGLVGNQFSSFQSAANTLEQMVKDDWMDYCIASRKFISRIILSQDLRNEISKQHYPLPMVSKPKPITKNKGGGYHSLKLPLLLGSRVSRHNYPLALDAINTLNAIPLLIRKDRIKPELVNPSDRKHHVQLKELAGLLPDSSPVHLTHAYDKRGRIYCRGYHFNYQGDSYHKSLIEIAIPEKLI